MFALQSNLNVNRINAEVSLNEPATQAAQQSQNHLTLIKGRLMRVPVENCYLPSSDDLHGYERRELQSRCICHIPVNLIHLTTELSILKQHHLSRDTSGSTLIRNNQWPNCIHHLFCHIKPQFREH